MQEESDPLQSLFDGIIDAESRGDCADRAALFSERPEHAESLRAFFAQRDAMKGSLHSEDATLPPRASRSAEDEAALVAPLFLEKAIRPKLETTDFADPGVGNRLRYFGDYELLEEIARGGMGVVYKARQTKLNRIVALKMILAGQLASAEDVKRFYTEAEAAANLDHPNIVPIFEVGQQQGQHYFSMGFIDGQSLAQKVTHGPLPPREAAELVIKICEAIAYAHQRGVIHRDLKPANILLDKCGNPKITDFGVAKQMNVDSGLTDTGQILGTPSYMAPEQARGNLDRVGPSADIYAIGAILYCLLTGRPPFQAASPLDTLLQVLDKAPVSPRVLNNQIPKDLETICLKSLEKEPRGRYSTSTHMADELNRYLNHEPILARPIGAPARAIRWCKRKPALASMGAFIGLLILVLAIGGPIVAVQQAALNRSVLGANRARARAQVDSLLTANPSSVPAIIQNLQANYELAAPQLYIRWDNKNCTEAQRIRLSLALLNNDRSHIEFLTERLTSLHVEEFLLIRQLLEPYAKPLIDAFWQIPFDDSKLPSEKFRSACLLALYDPLNARWKDIANDVVDELLSEKSLSVGDWVDAFRPVRNQLIEPLTRVFDSRSDEQTAQRILATSILAEYAKDNPRLLTELILDADPLQFGTLYSRLEPHAETVLPLLEQIVSTVVRSDNPNESKMHRVANGVIALVRLGQKESAWPLLNDEHDARIRSYLIDRFALLGVPVEYLIDELCQTDDASIRQACNLSLSGYSNDAISRSQRDTLIQWTTKAFRDDPDAGVHASCDLLLRKLNANVPTSTDARWQSVTAPSATAPSAGWFVSPHGQTFAVLGPHEFTMGSPPQEFGRRPDENQHQRPIPHRFAISIKEVTVKEFQKFMTAGPKINHTYSQQQSPEAECPQTSITWYEAAAYCNWLSEQEGIARSEWAFVANGEGNYASGVAIPADFLKRTGYRLPTEAEWEYACRAGSSFTRHYGNSESLIGKYAWFQANALDRSWPVGIKLPNRWGLFDMHGNVREWCANAALPYPSDESLPQEEFVDDQTITDGQPRALRGGCYFYHSIYLRAALRSKEPVDTRDFGIGMRVVRTLL